MLRAAVAMLALGLSKNRRQTESHQACLNGRGAKEGNSKLTDAHSRRRQSRQARAKRRAVCEIREICVKLNHLCEVILMRLPREMPDKSTRERPAWVLP